MQVDDVEDEEFADWVQEAIDGLPAPLLKAVSNVEVLIEHSAPGHPERLGLYQGDAKPGRRATRGTAVIDAEEEQCQGRLGE